MKSSLRRANKNMTFKVSNAFHDAELKGIDASNATNIVLLFCLEDGQRRSLTLCGCEFFRVTDFVSQNVVSRLLIFHGQDIDKGSITEKLRWATSLCDASSFLGQERLNDIIAKIQRGERSLLVLEPSCGAEMVILFEDMSN